MSATREMIACYRLYAANCLEIAEHVVDVERRVFFLNMARDWLKLAEQAERADTGPDGPQPHPDNPPQPPQDCSERSE
jgi:hypothetical protein